MTPKAAEQLARTSPAAFERIFALQPGPAPQSGTASFSNTQTSVTGGTSQDEYHAERKAFYQTMRRENYAKWQKDSTQKQMWKEVYGVDMSTR